MKYRYYLLNMEDGSIFGTNDSEIAEGTRESDYWAVIDVQENKSLFWAGQSETIKEYEPPDEADDELDPDEDEDE